MLKQLTANPCLSMNMIKYEVLCGLIGFLAGCTALFATVFTLLDLGYGDFNLSVASWALTAAFVVVAIDSLIVHGNWIHRLLAVTLAAAYPMDHIVKVSGDYHEILFLITWTMIFIYGMKHFRALSLERWVLHGSFHYLVYWVVVF